MKTFYRSIAFCFTSLLLLLGGYIEFYTIGQSHINQISTLFVSNAEATPSAKNLQLFKLSDSSQIVPKVEINNGASEANGILMLKDRNILIQLSRVQRSIRLYANASSLSKSSKPYKMIIDSTLSSGRELAYDNSNDALFVSNSSDSSIRIYDNLSSLNGKYIGRKIKLNAEPWGIAFDSIRNRLFVVMGKSALRIEIFNNPFKLSGAKNIPDLKFYINGFKTNGPTACLHGIAYTAQRDMLFVTDIGKSIGSTSESDGGIYIIDRVSKITNNSSILPHRAIYGTRTGLGNPVDISIDDRSTKGFIYVAERANKKILVFGFGDNGNIPPIRAYASMFSPEGIDISY